MPTPAKTVQAGFLVPEVAQNRLIVEHKRNGLGQGGATDFLDARPLGVQVFLIKVFDGSSAGFHFQMNFVLIPAQEGNRQNLNPGAR